MSQRESGAFAVGADLGDLHDEVARGFDVAAADVFGHDDHHEGDIARLVVIDTARAAAEHDFLDHVGHHGN